MDISAENKALILSLIGSGRIPQTVIIEGDSKDERDSAALLLAAGAVCHSGEKPCLSCKACRKILDGSHPDLIVPEPSKTSKTGIISIKDLREKYLSLAGIKPNEAELKIYLFYDADRLLREDSQNTLLKIIEEPEQKLLFIFTVEKASALLPTVRSRARLLTLRRGMELSGEAKQAARDIADGIVSLYEYDLLLRLAKLASRDEAEAALAAFTEALRLALSCQSGLPSDDPAALTLARRLDRGRILALAEATREAMVKLKTNINPQLLTTWLCTRYRRITWQK